jgi:6-phosphogluconolactonase
MRLDAQAHYVRVFEDAESLSRAAAGRFAEVASESIESSGRFAVALAGGSTPRRVYEILSGGDFGGALDWSKCHVFFGDERCVPPDDAESNYRMADESLLSRVALPRRNVHRMRGEGDAVANARGYEDELREFFKGTDWPAFDLVMLGMGDDGHTASLFPGSEALRETRAWVVANWVEKFGAYRLTLTAPSINGARRVLFLVAGAGKAATLREVLKGDRDPARLPSQLIRPAGGSPEWFVDRAASARL